MLSKSPRPRNPNDLISALHIMLASSTEVKRAKAAKRVRCERRAACTIRELVEPDGSISKRTCLNPLKVQVRQWPHIEICSRGMTGVHQIPDPSEALKGGQDT